MKYLKKPVIVEAIKFLDSGSGFCSLSEFGLPEITIDYHDQQHPVLKINTIEGIMDVQVGDYIIKEEGKFYTCKPDVFQKHYLPVTQANSIYTGDNLKNDDIAKHKEQNASLKETLQRTYKVYTLMSWLK